MVKKPMVDGDSVLTEEEKQLVDESIEEERKGLLLSFATVKKKLGIK